MTNQKSDVVTGVVIEEHESLSLDEVSQFCTVRREQIIALVEEGILAPVGAEPGQWRFPESNLRRAARALRLHRDLEANLAGVALVLDLLDEIDMLRAEVRKTTKET